MEKKFVRAEENKAQIWLIDHFTIGTKVIVVDGSYMTEHDSKNHVSGKQFLSGDGRHELLTVTSINVPRRTNGTAMDSLIHHNNCQITGNDGRVYNCSKINIRRWEV